MTTLKKEIQTIKSDRKALREFGLVVGSALIILPGILWFWKGFSHFLPCAYSGTALVVLGLAYPPALKPLQKAWMAMALCIGWVVGRFLMILIFFLVLTPLGLVLRLRGKHFLETRLDPRAESYWMFRKDTEVSRTACERQY